MRELINANDRILNITPALNGPKIINVVLINARRAIRVNNMISYFCVIRYQTLHRCHPTFLDSIRKWCQKFRAPSGVIATIFAVFKLKSQPPENMSLKPVTTYPI